MNSQVNIPNQALQSDTQSVAAFVQFASLILLHKSRATLGAAELGVGRHENRTHADVPILSRGLRCCTVKLFGRKPMLRFAIARGGEGLPEKSSTTQRHVTCGGRS